MDWSTIAPPWIGALYAAWTARRLRAVSTDSELRDDTTSRAYRGLLRDYVRSRNVRLDMGHLCLE